MNEWELTHWKIWSEPLPIWDFSASEERAFVAVVSEDIGIPMPLETVTSIPYECNCYKWPILRHHICQHRIRQIRLRIHHCCYDFWRLVIRLIVRVLLSLTSVVTGESVSLRARVIPVDGHSNTNWE